MENQINLFTIQDVYDHMEKQQPLDITKKYDPLHFWDNYGDKYYRDHKKYQDFSKHIPWLLQRLKPLKIETLLDAGCGFCRVEPFLLEGGVVKHITAIDISQKQLDAAEEYLKPVEPKREAYQNDEDFAKAQEKYKNFLEFRKNIDIKKQTIKWSKTPDNSYDCTLSIECMQHMHLPTARYAMLQLKKLTKKYAIIIERFVFPGEHPSPHIWSHDYAKIMTDMGMKLRETNIMGNGMVAMVFEK